MVADSTLAALFSRQGDCVPRRGILCGVQHPGGWFRQAERGLEQAQSSARSEQHGWACFDAQQAAEKAVKAVHLSLGKTAFGYVIARLLLELPVEVPDKLVEQARILDNLYASTRIALTPDSHSANQSRQAIDCAGEIIAFLRNRLTVS
jgi:HEPN domain-containing protein